MRKTIVAIAIASLSPGLIADDGLDFHEDYYLGFSQGAYYGLMLVGVDYDVAWCMKSELAYEAAAMGTGGEFQAKMEQMLADCREQYPPREAQ
jgi:hypothetical protein